MISVRASELFPAGILTQESLSISVSLRGEEEVGRWGRLSSEEVGYM